VTTIASITLGDDPSRWRDAGFFVHADGHCTVGSVRLLFEPAAGAGITSWTLAGAPDESVDDVDGLPTRHGDPFPSWGPADHAISAVRLDHLVVTTPDLDRTCAAVERTLGLPLKRVRDGESPAGAVRQGFFRMGEVILEVVGPVDPRPDGGPARFWGLAVVVADLAGAFDLLGEARMSLPKPAVQPGRFISRLRSEGVPVALMAT
jgi:catechol 2,3-dioxygenase-like lactoylglutathione lyase family enzyme